MKDARKEYAEAFEALAEETMAERPKVLKSKGGEITRSFRTDKTGKLVTFRDIMQGLTLQQELEVAVQDGKRPKWFVCAHCKRRAEVPRTGPVSKYCRRCRSCVRCNLVTRNVMATGVCSACMTPEELKARHKANARKAAALVTPEQRKVNARKAAALRTPEQRKESARKAGKASAAAMTPEQREESARKAGKASAAAMTPEQRKERARKASKARIAETRRHERAVKKRKASLAEQP